MTQLEHYFLKFRKHIVGIDANFSNEQGTKEIIYADWTASGRIYAPIEQLLSTEISKYVANTHSENNYTGTLMTHAYHEAQKIIKQHVGALKDDILISSGSGMTGLVNKFQRILGLKVHEKFRDKVLENGENCPIVFVTHMEHHSNHTSWLETLADVEIINPDNNGLVDLEHLEALLQKYKNRKLKIASVTSCSNVTGIFTPYHEIAKIMHRHGGFCFVDFACSAPYTNINMHPKDPDESLDAIYFSPHKFLGGPGTTGILVFNSLLYNNNIPDQPGGGTVEWTNPWREHRYINDIETREDGGTPPFLQTIKVALSIKLKEEMCVEKIYERENEMIEIVWKELSGINGLHILADNIKKRLGIFSFYIDGLHYNLGVKLLNDKFGIQARGGCSCAGTYGHYLLHVLPEYSKSITEKINHGDFTEKPGWIRFSIHPTMTDNEVVFICNSIREMAKEFPIWKNDYEYIPANNNYELKQKTANTEERWQSWFNNKLS